MPKTPGGINGLALAYVFAGVSLLISGSLFAMGGMLEPSPYNNIAFGVLGVGVGAALILNGRGLVQLRFWSWLTAVILGGLGIALILVTTPLTDLYGWLWDMATVVVMLCAEIYLLNPKIRVFFDQEPLLQL